jgi:hypothetical protein
MQIWLFLSDVGDVRNRIRNGSLFLVGRKGNANSVVSGIYIFSFKAIACNKNQEGRKRQPLIVIEKLES